MLRFVLAAFSALLVLFGSVYAALAAIGLYMVEVGMVPPGEPMYLDELAPSVGEATMQTIVGIALIAAGFFLRRWAQAPMRDSLAPDEKSR